MTFGKFQLGIPKIRLPSELTRVYKRVEIFTRGLLTDRCPHVAQLWNERLERRVVEGSNLKARSERVYARFHGVTDRKNVILKRIHEFFGRIVARGGGNAIQRNLVSRLWRRCRNTD